MFYFSEVDDLASGAGSFYPLAPALLSIVLAKITLSPPAVFRYSLARKPPETKVVHAGTAFPGTVTG